MHKTFKNCDASRCVEDLTNDKKGDHKLESKTNGAAVRPMTTLIAVEAHTIASVVAARDARNNGGLRFILFVIILPVIRLEPGPL